VQPVIANDGGVARRPLFVLLDATWPEARKMFRKSPYLDQLPVLSLQPDQLSRYRLRSSRRDDHFCTSEVGALCLELALESHAAQTLEAYLDVFTHKVEQYVGNYFDVVEQITARIEKENRKNALLAKEIQKNKDQANVFAHKGGLHASAVARRRDLYEHVDPSLVGNAMRVVVSEMAGRSTLSMKADELGLTLDPAILGQILEDLKQLEYQGYHFEVADGSLELLLRRATGWKPEFFHVESFRVITDHHDGRHGGDVVTEATVKVLVGGDRVSATAEGNGPVNALDAALRRAIEPTYPGLSSVKLKDYRVRVVDTGQGTGAVTRVLIDSGSDGLSWTTIGVSENIIEASWQALYDSMVYALLHAAK
jgi:hypothetical protein